MYHHRLKGKSEDNEYIIALKWANESVDNDFKKCSYILRKLTEMRGQYRIEKPHFTNMQDINILAYAYGNRNEIDRLIKDIESIDGVEKAEAKPLIPV